MNSSKIKIQNTLPKIAAVLPYSSGSICQQWVRCGKPNCRCASGRREDQHPAYYAFWREAGKQRKCYVPASLALPLRQFCDERRRQQRRQRALNRSTLDEFRRLRDGVRDCEAALSGKDST